MRDEDTEKIALARVGTVINAKWTVDRLIGVGGMASVYAATHRNSKRAALKIMHPELSAQAPIRERFLREGYLSNMVDHPGVVTIDDDDITEDGCAFLVMELVEGETLEARLRRKGPLPPEEVLSFMDQVLHALATAHTRGVVHRDLKPENMLLAQNGEIKLLDFGIARARALSTDPTKTLTEGLMGTPAFMPPEQARGRWEEVDAQSDVWALGATMFTLLTGRNVHQAATTNEALAVAMMRHAPPLEEYRPDLPKSVLELVNKALAFEKKDRWPNATVMLLAVRKASSRLEEESLQADALAAARAVHADSQPDVFFGESDDVEQVYAIEEERATLAPPQSDAASGSPPDPSVDAPRRSSPSQEPPTNPISSEAPFAMLSAAETNTPPEAPTQPFATDAALAPSSPGQASSLDAGPSAEPAMSSMPASQPVWPDPPATSSERAASNPATSAIAAPAAQASEPLATNPESVLVNPDLGSVPSALLPSQTAASSSAPATPAPDALPARRIVPFSDVPATSTGMTRPTETTTARSALITAARTPTKSQWSIMGIGVAALLLALVAVAFLTAQDNAPSALTENPSRVSQPPPISTGIAASPVQAGPQSAGEPDKRGEAVDLEALPVLSAEATPGASAALPAPLYRGQPKRKGDQAEANIFSQARNLAVKRATARSGKLKTGKQE